MAIFAESLVAAGQTPEGCAGGGPSEGDTVIQHCKVKSASRDDLPMVITSPLRMEASTMA